MRLKAFINEKALQTGELQYVHVRMEKAKEYLLGKSHDKTVEQVCNILMHVFEDEILFNEDGGFMDSIDKESEDIGITSARFAGGYVSFDLNRNCLQALDNPSTYKRFTTILSDMFHHEMVHALQDQRMNDEQRSKEAKKYFKILQSGEDSKYYAYPAELMAFAMTAVREFKRNGLSKEQILNTIKSPDENAKKSFFFTEYMKHFASSDKKVWNKFLRYCSEYADGMKE